MKHGSLCTGYGGLDMAAQAVFGGELAWWSDIEPGPIKVMQHHTDAPNLGDLKACRWIEAERVDILTAGYPCQPFSNAGKRKGTDDPRHLWPWIAYAIAHLRPRVVVLENVGAHLKRGFRVVAADLAALGYRVSWTLLRASEVGAAHRRERLFIVAAAEDADLEPGGERWTAAPGQAEGRRSRTDAGGRGLRADALTLLPTPSAVSYGNNRGGAAGRVGKVRPSLEGIVKMLVPEGMGWQGWQEYEPAIRRWESVLDRTAPYPAARGPRGGVKVAPHFGEWLMGLPAGHITDVPDLSINERLKLVGNGVVPQQAERAIRWLWSQLAAIEVAA
jgi:DNA (cytosine-5)-methyltransferase 1